MRLHDPLWLMLLLTLPLLAIWIFKKRSEPTWRFPSLKNFQKVPKTFRARLIFVPKFFKLVAWSLLVIALARPQKGSEQYPIIRQGIAIMMTLDRSSSMSQKDFFDGKQTRDRFSTAQKAFRNFVIGDENLPGRPNDLIGMLSFARWADTHCPLTLDHEMILDLLEQTQTVSDRREDGTAIGEALAAACEKLKRTEKFPEPPRSKIIVLLTDGQETISPRVEDAISPMEAMELAKTLDIKIYTIGVAPKHGAAVTLRDPFTGKEISMGSRQIEVDEKLLNTLAQETGGQYFRATDEQSLLNVMEQINDLEKTRIEDQRYTQYSEKYRQLVLASMILLAMSYLMGSTVLKKGP